MSLPPLDIPGILRQYGLRPDKRLGQNFLIDTSALERIVESAGITPEDTVLEIGPGLGSLTRYLAERAKRVIAVEVDNDLIPALRQVLSIFTNVQVVAGDILALNPASLVSPDNEEKTISRGKNNEHNRWREPHYLVVANIPYYITSALIRHLLEARLQPERLVLTVQREVARRICAVPHDMSLLALSVQVYGLPKLVASIPAGAFYPAPEIDSSVVRIDLYPAPRIPFSQLDLFFRLAKAGFSQKRKTLRNALAGGLAWEPARAEAFLLKAQIDPKRRAETLSIDEWERLTRNYEA